MALDSVIQKLGDELTRPIRRESQVLYIFAEVRKLIEHEQEKDEHAYEVLEFFCNWALHITISRKSSADKIRLSIFQQIMHLAVLNKGLGNFLHEHNLLCDVVHDFRKWSGFIYLYTAVVAEVPLRYAKDDLGPTEVEELTIQHQPTGTGPQKMVRWFVTLKNGQKFNGGTLYGQYRDKQNRLIAMPAFWDEEFQI